MQPVHPRAAHLHAPPNQVCLLRIACLTWFSRSWASWSLGHVHSTLRDWVTYPWGLCYMIPISRSCVLPHSYIRVTGPLASRLLLHCLLGHVFPYARLGITFHVASQSRVPPLPTGHVLSTLRVTCLPGPGAHDIPLTPLHTQAHALEHASPLPRSQAHLASNLRVTCLLPHNPC